MVIVLTAVLAVLVAGCGPWVMRRIPEPADPEPDKPSYASIAGGTRLAGLLAVIAGVLAGSVAWATDVRALLPAWAVVCGVGVWLAYIDLRTRLLPYVVVAPLYLATVALVAAAAVGAGDHRILLRALVANVVVYLAFRILHLLGRRLGGALGYGDVRWAAVLSLVLGPLGAGATLVGLYASFVIGAVFGVMGTVLKLVDRRNFAFGPYLLLGAVFGAVWGPRLYGG